MKSSSGRQAHAGARPTWQPFKVRWMFFAAAAVLIIGFVVTMWLWIIAGHAKPGTDQANARLDAVRTGPTAAPAPQSGSCSPSAVITSRRWPPS
jgi:hypothetical protein